MANSNQGKFNISGIVRIKLTLSHQERLKCIIGSDITIENPWKEIRKDLILNWIDSELQPLLPYKQEIIDYTEEEMLIGYIGDESQDYDEFYLCVSSEAKQSALKMIKILKETRRCRFKNSINKTSSEWKSLNSEMEIDPNILKTHRGRLRMDLQTKYPTFQSRNLNFCFATEARNYTTELLVTEKYIVPQVHKRRIDCETQARPSQNSNYAQTELKFPKSTWTQYEYEYDPIENLSENFMKNFNDHFENNIDSYYDKMIVNGNLNLYTDDYKKLALNKLEQNILIDTRTEFKALQNSKRCKGKKISALSWHPMWTGIIAIGYSCQSTIGNRTGIIDYDNYLTGLVNANNVVLIWSLNDTLNPKLVLETNSVVSSLAFCPHNENLLVGGCVNGNIIIWEIQDKLDYVEKHENKSLQQLVHRNRLYGVMDWSRNDHLIPIIYPTILGNLLYSHQSPITSISWNHPNSKIAPNGQWEIAEKSNQFATSSFDGNVLIWDLDQNCDVNIDSSRKFRIIKEAPKLEIQKSIYKTLRPIYKIQLFVPNLKLNCPISFLTSSTPKLSYEAITDEGFNFDKRFFYKPVIFGNSSKEFVAGTSLGNVVLFDWKGYDELEDVKVEEKANLLNFGTYHDGQINVIQHHPVLKDVYLSVGGKVIAIWKNSLIGRPVFWRKSKHRYTHAQWDSNIPSAFAVNRSDGNREYWDLSVKTHTYLYEVDVSSSELLEGIVHPFKTNPNVIGISDNDAFRLLYIPDERINNNKYDQKLDFITKMLEHDADNKYNFKKWQDVWISRYATDILEAREKAKIEEYKAKKEQEEQLKKLNQRKAQEAVELAKIEALKLIPPPGKLAEWAEDMLRQKECNRMAKILIAKKKLDKDLLIKQQAILKEEEINRRKIIRNKLIKQETSEELFYQTALMLFPNVNLREQAKPCEPSQEDAKQQLLKAYDVVKNESDRFILENPPDFNFDWNVAFKETKKNERIRIKTPNSIKLRRLNK